MNIATTTLEFIILLCIVPSIALTVFSAYESRRLEHRLEHYKNKIEQLKAEMHYLNYKYTELFKLSKYSSLELEQLFITSENIKSLKDKDKVNTKDS